MSVLAIIIGLPFALAGAASQNIIIGALFGFVFALGIVEIIDSFKIS